MDINKEIETVKRLICKDISISIGNRPNELVAYPPFVYPDGDGCSFYLSRQDESWRITDDGEVLMHSAYGGVDLLEHGHRERLDKMLAAYKVEQSDGVLSMLATQEHLGSAFFSFTQACLDVMHLARSPATKKKRVDSVLKQRLANAIHDVFDPDQITRPWHHPTDTDNTYTVDYLIETPTRKLCVFGIGSDTSCLKAACTCYHLIQKQFPFMGVAVLPSPNRIHSGALKPLTDAARTEIISSMTNKALREFFLALAA